MVEFTFKKHPLSESERTWLKEVATTKPFDAKVAKIKLRDKIPNDFDPRMIDQCLYMAGKVMPLGIWHLMSDDPIFTLLDQVIKGIRSIIFNNPGVEQLTASEISNYIKVEEGDVERALYMLGQLGSFYSMANGGKDPDRIVSITLSGDNAYNEYLLYQSIDELLERHYLSMQPREVGSDPFAGFFGADARNGFASPAHLIERKSIKTNTAFIIMAINPARPELEDVYNTIKDVFRKFDIVAYRADEIEHQDRITDIILQEIRECEFLIADISDARPNVYYEVGYSHALGQRPILFRKEGTQLHFDLAGYNVPEYKNNTELKEILTQRLKAILGREPKDSVGA